jgi:hypothetical protein
MFKVREVVIAIGGDTEMEAGYMHRPPGVGGFSAAPLLSLLP